MYVCVCAKYRGMYVCVCVCLQGVCTEAGMYALRERRVHVTQEDFEMAVAKVIIMYRDLFFSLLNPSDLLSLPPPLSLPPFPLPPSLSPSLSLTDNAEGFREEHVHQETVEVNSSPWQH